MLLRLNRTIISISTTFLSSLPPNRGLARLQATLLQSKHLPEIPFGLRSGTRDLLMGWEQQAIRGWGLVLHRMNLVVDYIQNGMRSTNVLQIFWLTVFDTCSAREIQAQEGLTPSMWGPPASGARHPFEKPYRNLRARMAFQTSYRLRRTAAKTHLEDLGLGPCHRDSLLPALLQA